jgi:hypothetical protein
MTHLLHLRRLVLARLEEEEDVAVAVGVLAPAPSLLVHGQRAGQQLGHDPEQPVVAHHTQPQVLRVVEDYLRKACDLSASSARALAKRVLAKRVLAKRVLAKRVRHHGWAAENVRHTCRRSASSCSGSISDSASEPSSDMPPPSSAAASPLMLPLADILALLLLWMPMVPGAPCTVATCWVGKSSRSDTGGSQPKQPPDTGNTPRTQRRHPARSQKHPALPNTPHTQRCFEGNGGALTAPGSAVLTTWRTASTLNTREDNGS